MHQIDHQQRKQKRHTRARKSRRVSWFGTRPPSSFCTTTIRVDQALHYIENYRASTGRKLTITHLVVKASAILLRERPALHPILRGNRLYARQRTSILVGMVQNDRNETKSLVAARLLDAESKTLEEIIDVFECERKGSQANQAMGLFRFVPVGLLRFILRTHGFLAYRLNLNLGTLGFPTDPFGGFELTNAGSLGLDVDIMANPLMPFTSNYFLCALGYIKKSPVVEGDRVVAGKTLSISFTFDPRALDLNEVSGFAKALGEFIEHPFEKFETIPHCRPSRQPGETACSC